MPAIGRKTCTGNPAYAQPASERLARQARSHRAIDRHPTWARRTGALALLTVAAATATYPAQAQVFTSWNPLYSVGDWDWYVQFNPTPFWVHVPFSVGGIGVGPEQGIPPNNGEWQFFVTISSGDINLSTIKTVSALLVNGDAKLLINTGTLTSLVSVANASEIELNAAGTLFTPLFENAPLAKLHATSASQLFATTLDNHGMINADTGALITAGVVNNYDDGTLIVDPGGLVLSTGLVNNNGEIRIDTAGSELLATTSSLTLTGSGLLVLDHDTAVVTSLATINNLGNHTIRGKGSVVAGVLNNSALIRADEANDTLRILAAGLDNSGRLLALGLAALDIQASGITNSGLLQASGASRIDIDAGSLDNSGTNRTPDVPPLAPIGEGSGISAIDASAIKIANADIDNGSGLIEARGESLMQFEEVTLDGGLLYSDATSLLAVTGGQSKLGNFTLDGVLQIASGGHANLHGNMHNRAGEIRVLTGGHVDFEYGTTGTLIGGSVTGGGTLAKEVFVALTFDAQQGLHLQDVTMSIYQGGYLRLLGELTNDATLHIRDIESSNAYVYVDGAVGVHGGGAITFFTAGKNFISPWAAGAQLTNHADHTIESAGAGTWGQILVDLVNHGTLDADGGFISLASATTRNDGLLESSNGGVLQIGTAATLPLDNTGGVIAARAGSLTQLVNLMVQDGELAGDGTIQIAGVTRLHSTEMHITGNVQVPSTSRLYLQGEFVNDGSLYLNDHESGSGMFGALQAFLFVTGEVVLDGTGRLAFGTANNGNLLQPDPTLGGSILQRAGHSITTINAGSTGSITANLTNFGTVDADDGYLVLDTTEVINRGLLEASDGGHLLVGRSNGAASLDNAGGTIRAGAGSQLSFVGNTVRGGFIGGDGLILPTATIFDATVAAMTVDGNVYIDYNNRLTLRGALTNDGTIRLNDTHSNSGAGFNPYLLIDGAVTLGGVGEIRFTSPNQGAIDDLRATDRLVQLAGHTIHTVGTGSRGFLDVNLDNHGLIQADDGYLHVRSVDNVNTGRIAAVNAGTMVVSAFSPGVLNNAGGTLFVDESSNFQLSSLNLQGGRLDGDGYFTIQGLVTYDSTTAAGPVTVDANTLIGLHGTLTLKGEVINNGRMRLVDSDSRGGRATLAISGEVGLGGSGFVEYNSPYENYIQAASSTGTHRLTIGADQSIKALGATTKANLTVNFTNRGDIVTDDALLAISGLSNVNTGTIRSVNGGETRIQPPSSGVLDNGGGTLFADGTSSFLLSSMTVHGGTFEGDGRYVIQGTVTFDSTTGAGATTIDANTSVGGAGTLGVKGTVVNNGQTWLADPDFGGVRSSISVIGDSTIAGHGSVVFASTHNNQVISGGAGARLTIGPDMTFSSKVVGFNDIGVPIIVEGTLGADGGNYRFFNTNLTNNGLIRSSNGSNLQITFPVGGSGGWLADGAALHFSSHITTQGDVTARNGAHLTASAVQLNGRDLSIIEGSSLSFLGTTVRLTGDFSFDISDESDWFWSSNSILEMRDGGGAATLDAGIRPWSLLEIGGMDHGLDPENHIGAPEGFANSNFWLPKLVVGPGVAVALVDFFDNGHRNGGHGAAEALYVGQLLFGDSDSILDLRGYNLYYQTLIGSTVQIVSTPIPPQGAVAALCALWVLGRRSLRRNVA